MDILDRLLAHDAWTTRQLLMRAAELSDEQLDREFDIGHRSVRRTFLHLIANMEVWTDLISGRPPDVKVNADPANRSVPAMLRRLDAAAGRLADVATRLARENRLDEMWTDPLDNPPTQKSYGGAIAHVITHSMHHRAQLLCLLRRVGVVNLIEGDVLSWEKQHRDRGNPVRP